MFIDQATIVVRAGKGGNGIISFRREKFLPKGGPDGGNGGNGGSVIIRADRQLTTLMDFQYKNVYKAHNGVHGMGANKTGKSGDDCVIRVPAGTIIKDANSGETCADLIHHGDEIVIARGGKGGRGNQEFATPTDQAPRRQTDGTPGEEKTIQLELKLLADIGLVGFPNAGKSTLISRISAAKPRIADYPFTTLVPNLGIVHYAEYKSFVVADMPGLIKGAHEGKGLGIQFLKHIERTRVIVFMIDCTSEDLKNQYTTLVEELRAFNPAMLRKPQIVAVSKMDLADEDTLRHLKQFKILKRTPVIPISAVSGAGIKELLDTMWTKLESERSTKKRKAVARPRS